LAIETLCPVQETIKGSAYPKATVGSLNIERKWDDLDWQEGISFLNPCPFCSFSGFPQSYEM
jgi:hypothetical protein